MYNFISSNWESVLVVILFIVAMIFMIKKGATKQVNQILFYLVMEAEAQFGSGTGQLKYAAVVAWLFERMPAIVKIILSEKQIDFLIENAVIRMKEYLDTNNEAKMLILPISDAPN